ncbi:hypothetical protein ACHAWF_005433 [Thalassiosira exigua]
MTARPGGRNGGAGGSRGGGSRGSLDPDGRRASARRRPSDPRRRRRGSNGGADGGCDGGCYDGVDSRKPVDERPRLDPRGPIASPSSRRLSELERRAEVEKYARLARRKASLITRHDFERRRSSGSGGRRDAPSNGIDPCEGSRPPTEPPGVASPSRAPEQAKATEEEEDDEYDEYVVEEWYEEDDGGDVDGLPPDMTGRSVAGPSSATTVSSMTSVDSYVLQQKRLREARMERIEEGRRRREERKRMAGEMDYFDEGTQAEDVTVMVEDDEEDSLLPGSFCPEVEEEKEGAAAEEGPSGGPDLWRHDGPDGGRDGRNGRGRGPSHGDVRSRAQSASRSRAPSHARSRAQSQTPSRTSSRESHSHNKSHPSPFSGSSNNLHYQRGDACIRHPDVTLEPQTEVHVQTCMRHVKDPRTGRWRVAKMVCRSCLDEEEDACRGDIPAHRRFRSHLRSFVAEGGRKRRILEGLEEFDEEGEEDEMGERSDDEGGATSGAHSSSASSSSSRGDGSGRSRRTPGARRGSDGRTNVPVRPQDDQTPLEREAEAQRRRFARRLAARAYHFPGNTWCEDWIQYTSNTHLVFGIFFHHPLHPVTGRERCVILLGSVAVGLLMSNLIYLWFVSAGYGKDDTVLSLGGTVDVTKLMIALWTLGSVAHSIFDLSLWHIKACTPCRYGSGSYVSDEAVQCGRTAGVTIVLATLAFATYLVLLRASEDYNEGLGVALEEEEVGAGEAGDESDEGGRSFIKPISLGGEGSVQYFGFLIGYIVEFLLAVFVYNPLILTIVFAGVLGCNGRIPVLGGRPREVMRERRYAMKRQRYTMPQTLRLGDQEYEADMWGRGGDQKLVTNF